MHASILHVASWGRDGWRFLRPGCRVSQNLNVFVRSFGFDSKLPVSYHCSDFESTTHCPSQIHSFFIRNSKFGWKLAIQYFSIFRLKWYKIVLTFLLLAFLIFAICYFPGPPEISVCSRFASLTFISQSYDNF